MREGRRTAGFTLIELLAVVLMLAMLAAVAYPTLNLGGQRALRQEADELATAVEFARQRAVMTGRPHRLVLDLERGFHWIEWQAPGASGLPAALDGAGEQPGPTVLEPSGAPLDLAPPELESGAFVPIDGPFGRGHLLDAGVWVLAVELGGRVAEQGVVTLELAPDGSSDAASILLGDPEGRDALVVEVRPLADAVRVHRPEA